VLVRRQPPLAVGASPQRTARRRGCARRVLRRRPGSRSRRRARSRPRSALVFRPRVAPPRALFPPLCLARVLSRLCPLSRCGSAFAGAARAKV